MTADDVTRAIVCRPPGPVLYANLQAQPKFVLHLKDSAQADLPARARPITDPGERRLVLLDLLPGIGRADQLDTWLAGSPIVEVERDH